MSERDAAALEALDVVVFNAMTHCVHCDRYPEGNATPGHPYPDGHPSCLIRDKVVTVETHKLAAVVRMAQRHAAAMGESRVVDALDCLLTDVLRWYPGCLECECDEDSDDLCSFCLTTDAVNKAREALAAAAPPVADHSAAKPQRWGTHYETIPHSDCMDQEHCDCDCPGCPGIQDAAATGEGAG